MVGRTCNPMCSSCYGVSAARCYACVAPYMLNNNTCAASCLTGYGPTDVPTVCVYCERHCKVCYLLANNCSSCQTSGAMRSFLHTVDPTYPICVAPCPAPYFANSTASTCDLCDSNCTACITNATHCTSCVAGLAWANYYCYNPCPSKYFLDVGGINCTKCSPFCAVCSGTFDSCTVCTYTGPYKSYLLTVGAVTTCNRTCPTGMYPFTNSTTS